MRDIDHHLVSAANATAVTVVAAAAWCAISSRLPTRRCGRIFRRLALRDGLFLILEAQLQIATTVSCSDRLPIDDAWGVRSTASSRSRRGLAQHLLQRDRIVRRYIRSISTPQ